MSYTFLYGMPVRSMTRLSKCTGNTVSCLLYMKPHHPPPHPPRKDLSLTMEGSVIRITPDEVHVQEQLHSINYVDCWIKGTKVLDSGSRQSGGGSRHFQIRKRSMSRVRSILQVEFHQIIRGLVQNHQVHKVLSSRIRPFFPVSSPPMIPVDLLEESDQSGRSFSGHRSQEVFGEA